MRVARLAFAYRQAFHKDVVIDMVCYRRHGHNEGDDPSYTQPLMYKRIDARRSVRKLYTEALVKKGDISLEEAEAALDDFQRRLQVALDETRSQAHARAARARARAHLPRRAPPRRHRRAQGGPRRDPRRRSSTVPEGFTVHPKLAKQFEGRRAMYDDGEVDWALGEALAFGSLLLRGHVGARLRRGLPPRHVLAPPRRAGRLRDRRRDRARSRALARDGARFWIYDSLLSEFAVLGFEYGYSVENKDALVVWEAQFGDFVNGAQVIIDQFIVAAEDKWDQTSGLVMLLPHGYEGQGPEHSSARIERFLTLCGRATTSRSATPPPRPSSSTCCAARCAARSASRWSSSPRSRCCGPRRPARRSSALVNGSFQEVLDDPGVTDPDVGPAGRVRLGQGRRRGPGRARQAPGTPVAIARVEQLYPWPYERRRRTCSSQYPNADEIVWLQEEPENMGAWNHIKGRLYEAHETPTRSAG